MFQRPWVQLERLAASGSRTESRSGAGGCAGRMPWLPLRPKQAAWGEGCCIAARGRANLTGLVLGCIEAKFCKKILSMRLNALAEIYTMHSFAQLCNILVSNVCQHFATFSKFGWQPCIDSACVSRTVPTRR